MVHKVTIAPIQNSTTKCWQAWCYNDNCDWYAEGFYEGVWEQAEKHRGRSVI